MRTGMLLGLLLSIAGLQSPIIAADAVPNGGVASGLLATDYAQRQLAARAIVDANGRLVTDLISIATRPDVDPAFGGAKYWAIELLGNLRSVQAIAALSKNLLYRPLPRYTWEIGPQEAYHVAAMALVNIGSACIPEMVYLIKISESKDERNLAAWVIMKIDGKDMALARLDMEISRTGGREPKEHLKAAREFIATYKPNFTPPRPAPAGSKDAGPTPAPR